MENFFNHIIAFILAIINLRIFSYCFSSIYYMLLSFFIASVSVYHMFSVTSQLLFLRLLIYDSFHIIFFSIFFFSKYYMLTFFIIASDFKIITVRLCYYFLFFIITSVHNITFLRHLLFMC